MNQAIELTDLTLFKPYFKFSTAYLVAIAVWEI